MNFMSGRSGFCEEITNSTPSSPSTPNFNFRADAGEPAYPPPTVDSSHANNGGDDSDYHMRQLGEEGGSKSRSAAAVIEREHMFDKVVTPSDVGKLNRLVIPKQHAEKYFPLDSSSNEKGLLLNFEDRNGKPWRFRYSYWNSSQSYVMTKGWSRFVKEKKLDAGDIVSFQRGVGDAAAKGRLFIDWRHRPDLPEIPPPSIPHQFSFHRSSIYPWSPLFTSPAQPHFLQPPGSIAIAPNQSYFHHHQHYHHHHALTANYTVVNGNPCSPASIMYLRSASASGGAQPLTIGQTAPPLLNAMPVVQGKAAAKRLRLFGVNMECPVSESDATQPHPTISLHHLLPSPSSPGNQTQNRRTDHKGKGSISLDLDI